MPYMLIIGDKEQEEGTVAVRRRDTNVTETMKVEDFIALITNEIATKGQKA